MASCCAALLSAAFLILNSCTDRGYTLIRMFPTIGELKPVNVIRYDPVEIDLYSIVGQVDDYWLVYATKNQYSYALTDKNFKPIVHFCGEGNGPGEFQWGVVCDSPRPRIEGDSLIVTIKDMARGTVNMTAVCIRDGMSKSKKTGEVSIMNRARYSLSNGTVIVNNNENRYFLIGQDGDTTYFETWGDNIDAKEYEDWWIPRLQTDEIFTTDSSRMLVYTDRPYVWLHRTDGTLIKKVFVEKRPDEVREDFGGLGFDCGRLFGDHFLLMISDLVSENPIKVSNRLMLFDYDMNPEAVYSIPGENLDFYSDPKTGLVWIPDPSEEVIRVYDLSEWI